MERGPVAALDRGGRQRPGNGDSGIGLRHARVQARPQEAHLSARFGCDLAGQSLVGRLAAEGIEAIVVAIDHGGRRRIREYNPFPYWRGGRGAVYLRFVVETVKRIVDHDFRTLPGRDQTRLVYSLRMGFGRFSPTR